MGRGRSHKDDVEVANEDEKCDRKVGEAVKSVKRKYPRLPHVLPKKEKSQLSEKAAPKDMEYMHDMNDRDRAITVGNRNGNRDLSAFD